MTSRYLPLLATLTAVWGSSFMFIKVAVEEIPPSATMALRFLVAGAVLAGVLAVQRGGGETLRSLRAALRPALLLGLLNAALPFYLLGWGIQHIDSGVAAIALATVPLFTALLAIRLLPSERIRGLRLVGVVVGLAGIAVLTGADPQRGGWALAGTLAVVVGALLLALAGIYGQRRMAEIPGPVLVTGSTLVGGLVLLPFGLLQLPAEVPGWKPLASVLALAVVATAFGGLVLFRLLRLHGAAKTGFVTYLLPPTALVYGGLLLGESIRPSMLAGLALILAGVAVGSGAVRLSRRNSRAQTVPEHA